MATISRLLADRVTLQVRSVDRLFFQGYVPRLQTQFQVIRFLLDRGFPIPSPAALGRIGREYVSAVERFIVVARDPGGALSEGRRQRGDRARAFQGGRGGGTLRGGDGRDRAGAHVGVARVAEGGPDGHPHFEYRRQQVFPHNYYWYIRDPDWGPTFLKTVAYAPFSVWLYLSGNEWAKRQAIQR